jgi:hypothetical protein
MIRRFSTQIQMVKYYHPDDLWKGAIQFKLTFFCDAVHGTCHATRRSTTGIILFVNGAPISWYSKRQNTIESTVVGSEFVALQIAVEMN